MGQSIVANDLCVLIATKDRTNELNELLFSIASSMLTPKKVLIVSSGTNISHFKSKYSRKIDLEIIHSDVSGQSIQKSIGINLLSSNYEWILFLDDDVVLESSTLEILYNEYITNPIFKSYLGFGLGITNRSTRNQNRTFKYVLRQFNLFSDTPGSITKSGHAQSYLDHGVQIEVDWLNGISAWNSKVLSHYSSQQISIPYSAYEDVAFSYKVSKRHKLLFVPRARVQNQKMDGGSPLTLNQFVCGGYSRYKFVFDNIELSKKWLLVTQIIRGADFIFRKNQSCDIFTRIKVAIKLWISLAILTVRKRNSDENLAAISQN